MTYQSKEEVCGLFRLYGPRWRRTEGSTGTYEGLRSFIQAANILDSHPAPIHDPDATSTFINFTSVPSPTRLQPIDKRQILIGCFREIRGERPILTRMREARRTLPQIVYLHMYIRIPLFAEEGRRRINLGGTSSAVSHATIIDSARLKRLERLEQKRRHDSACKLQEWWRGVIQIRQLKKELRARFEADSARNRWHEVSRPA
ncbi:hypothetical protein F5887DRAFT_918031 [Amanita rubescens]|nr:hypothetical protein F5887DRAFT_918031 [Amanita rubescens]